MFMICLYWKPIEGTLWSFSNSFIQAILITVHISGWLLAVLSTFFINHFELFGLQQVYCKYMNKHEPPLVFTERFMYRIVRHPLQLGVLIGLWVIPTMTMTHFVLATGMTIYIFIGLYFEEKDLVKTLGHKYSDYQTRVNKLCPIFKF